MKTFFGAKTFLVQKRFKCKKILGQKRFWGKNVFGAKTFLVQKRFWCKNVFVKLA